MNKPAFIVTFSIVTATHMAFADPVITDVTAQPRHPWNGKVDIAYTVSGNIAAAAHAQAAIPSLKVTATDRETGTTYRANSLSGDTGLWRGTHMLVWDMEAQGLSLNSPNVVFSVSCEMTPATYCVIDLKDGPDALSYPVHYFAEPPSGGFNVDDYKLAKIVLKRIEAGSFKMGENQDIDVTLTKPFFIGLFEVTQAQYFLVTKSAPSGFRGVFKPVEQVSYHDIRGSTNGAEWPSSSAVDSSSFLGKLRGRTGLEFDLPTEAQWEYACRAGTTTAYSYGGYANEYYMWYYDNSLSQTSVVGTETHKVGTKPPNPWGLYDMHGNVSEWCLDWYAISLNGGSDPKGSSSGSKRVLRGGGPNRASDCTSSHRFSVTPARGLFDYGFRLCLTLNP